MPSDVQIYAPKVSEALRFVLDFIFDDFYGCGYELISEEKGIRESAMLFNYSDQFIAHQALQIVPNKYLFQNNLSQFPEVTLLLWDKLPAFFETEGTIPFDLFAAAFFLLSRAEEYGNPKRDRHHRFSSESSIFKDDFIQRPIIDEWLLRLKNEFLLGTDIAFAERQFKWTNTYDIDVAYAYLHRSVKHIIAAAARNIIRGDFKSFVARFRVLWGNSADPYDTYDLQKDISEKYADETVYFFLLGDKSKYDRNLPPASKGMKSLIKSCEEYARIGIHPSYISGDKQGQLSVEINRLSNITSKSINASRQHFLKVNLPTTYQNLIKSGITEDYSLGYADLPGFRSGTCTRHYFYDLEKNTKTALRIFPLILMEGSLRDYLKLERREARELTFSLIDRVKSVNGNFISLWHNDSLAQKDSNFWRELYMEMAEYINHT